MRSTQEIQTTEVMDTQQWRVPAQESRSVSSEEYAVLQSKYNDLQSKYEDLLKRDAMQGATVQPNLAAQGTQAGTQQSAHPQESWTEQEKDDDRRRDELGLPPLKQDRADAVEADMPWPSPIHEVTGVRLSIGAHCKEIRERMLNGVRGKITDAISFYQADSKAPKPLKAALVSNPEPGLECIYATFFASEPGRSWRMEANRFLKAPIPGGRFLEGLVGAALHEMVFMQPLPWKGASDWFDTLQPIAPYWNHTIKRKGKFQIHERVVPLVTSSGNKEFLLEGLVWEGQKKQLGSATFQNRTIMPIAKALAEQLEMALQPQLESLGISGGRAMADDKFWNNASANLTEVFMEALSLKGALAATPLEVEFSWVPVGRTFDDATMDRPLGSPPNSAGIVARATTPLLKYKCVGVDGLDEWEV